MRGFVHGTKRTTVQRLRSLPATKPTGIEQWPIGTFRAGANVRTSDAQGYGQKQPTCHVRAGADPRSGG
jgi:hypothetical protein